MVNVHIETDDIKKANSMDTDGVDVSNDDSINSNRKDLNVSIVLDVLFVFSKEVRIVSNSSVVDDGISNGVEVNVPISVVFQVVVYVNGNQAEKTDVVNYLVPDVDKAQEVVIDRAKEGSKMVVLEVIDLNHVPYLDSKASKKD